MSQAGNSNTITRNYPDSLLIETRYMNSDNPDTGLGQMTPEVKEPICPGSHHTRHTTKSTRSKAGCSSIYPVYSILVASPRPLNLTDLTTIFLVSSSSSKVSYSASGTSPSKVTV